MHGCAALGRGSSHSDFKPRALGIVNLRLGKTAAAKALRLTICHSDTDVCWRHQQAPAWQACISLQVIKVDIVGHQSPATCSGASMMWQGTIRHQGFRAVTYKGSEPNRIVHRCDCASTTSLPIALRGMAVNVPLGAQLPGPASFAQTSCLLPGFRLTARAAGGDNAALGPAGRLDPQFPGRHRRECFHGAPHRCLPSPKHFPHAVRQQSCGSASVSLWWLAICCR